MERYIGRKWGEINEVEQEELLRMANICDDVKEGDCIVDLNETLSVWGTVVDSEEERVLVISDDAVIYNPTN